MMILLYKIFWLARMSRWLSETFGAPAPSPCLVYPAGTAQSYLPVKKNFMRQAPVSGAGARKKLGGGTTTPPLVIIDH